LALNAHGARRWRSGVLAALAAACVVPLAGVATSAAAEPGARQVPLPPGLASVWRVDGRKADGYSAGWSLATFSTDGKLVGVADDGGTRIYDASDGRLVRMLPPPYSTGQFAYSLAISSTGLVAMGRVGGVDVYELGERGEPLKFYCGGICGPVSALAFSPNGAWLASQAARSTLETPGLVNVVDLRAGARSAELEASSTRAGVMFAPDGSSLIAANVTRVDGTGTFGMRRFSTSAEWRRTRDVAGAQVPRGSVGPYAFNERVAAYAFRGNVELREVATGALVWARPFVPPGLDSATDDAAMKLELVVFAPRGDVLLAYESPVDRGGPGALVVRRMTDGDVVAVYDVVGLSALAIAPDGERFMYSTGVGRTYTALARVPR
jgi:hypothetical protein